MQNKEKCLHATPLSETALIPTTQIRKGKKSKEEKEGMKGGGKETKRGEGRLEGKGREGGREGGGRRGCKERREGLHLKMHRIRFISRQI